MKDFKIPRNKSLFFIEYWSKNIEEDFHQHNPDHVNLSGKYTTQDVINVMNSMANHVNSTDQGMIQLQEKFSESENGRLKQSIGIDQLTGENISTQKSLQQLLYVLNDVHASLF